ncbi:MAG TPA: DMT family transporter [Candidatus Limnocylindrales bacterium]
MIAILGGLGAAVMWAFSGLTSSRSTRLIGASSNLAWMMLVGLAISTPLALASGPVPPITPALAGWMATSGITGVVGLLVMYRGLRIGKVGVVAALASTEGAIAAVISVIAGERLTIQAVAMLCVIVVGVATVALATGNDPGSVAANDDPTASDDPLAGNTAVPGASSTSGSLSTRIGTERQAAMYGAIAAVIFGVNIYSTAQLGHSLPTFMAVMPVRLVGVVAVFVPMALTGRLRMVRPAVPMVVLIGALEVFGNSSYVIGSRESIAIAAVLASQFAAVAAVAAFFLFHERLSLGQRSGIVAIALGVAVLSAVQA